MRISRSGAALLSLLLNISLTMDRRFQMPSGSLPLRGLSKQAHSAAAGGSVEERYMEFTSLKETPSQTLTSWQVQFKKKKQNGE